MAARMPAGSSFSPSWTRCWRELTRSVAGLYSIISRGGFIDREYVGSADPSLAVHRFHARRDREHCCPDAANPGHVDRAAGIRPLIPLLATGLYMFALPYVGRRGGARQ